MKIEVLADADAVAKGRGDHCSRGPGRVADRGHFIFAVSGGRTPWLMLRLGR